MSCNVQLLLSLSSMRAHGTCPIDPTISPIGPIRSHHVSSCPLRREQHHILLIVNYLNRVSIIRMQICISLLFKMVQKQEYR